MAMDLKDNSRRTLCNCLSQQISEYELLKSMYPNQGEIILNDKHILNKINNFLDDVSNNGIPNHLDFKLNLHINGLKLELFINLPSSYPEEEPDIYVMCNQLNRQHESRLNSELSLYLKENHVGEVCLYTAISWLQENIEHFLKQPEQNPINTTKVEKRKDRFVRLWIYSHHIYNKKKRDEILKISKDLKLTGFCLPGKPGIICIEGCNSDCDVWWKNIKSMNWKKIMIRKTETFESVEEGDFKKLSHFKELILKILQTTNTLI